MASLKLIAMANKRNSKCLKKAAPDEPIFVLRAQDESAPAVIRYWIHLNQHTLSRQKMEGAFDTMAEMEKWPNRKKPD